MRRLTLLVPLLALLLACTAADPLLAQQPPELYPSCMPAEELARFLEEEFAELPMARGVSDAGVLVTMFAAKAPGTWTIAVTEPSGLSCIVAAGTGFELMPEALALRGDPTPTGATGTDGTRAPAHGAAPTLRNSPGQRVSPVCARPLRMALPAAAVLAAAELPPAQHAEAS
jgi:hypothetical protein